MKYAYKQSIIIKIIIKKIHVYKRDCQGSSITIIAIVCMSYIISVISIQHYQSHNIIHYATYYSSSSSLSTPGLDTTLATSAGPKDPAKKLKIVAHTPISLVLPSSF